jgi:PleD family two-component response regulator
VPEGSPAGSGAVASTRFVRSRPSTEAPAATEAPTESMPIPTGDPLLGRRVRVVDDEEPVRNGTRQTLLAWGWLATVAADADKALAACSGLPTPDIMLVDFRLPLREDGRGARNRPPTLVYA